MRDDSPVCAAGLVQSISPRFLLFGILALSVRLGDAEEPQTPPGGGPAGLHALPDARVDEPYEYGVAFRGLVEPVRFRWAGEPPPGIRFRGPLVYGTPTVPQEEASPLRLTVTDALGASLTRRYSLCVRPALQPLRLLTTQIPSPTVDQPYDFELAATGGEGAYRWEVAADGLPKGLELRFGEDQSSCHLTGTPEASARFRLDVQVSDTFRSIDPLAIKGRVRPVVEELRLTTKRIPSYKVGDQVHFEFSASGGEGRYRWKVASIDLPGGLELKFGEGRGSCALAGIPEQTGEYRIIASVEDAFSKPRPVHLKGFVGPAIAPALEVRTSRLPPATYQTSYSERLCAEGGKPPYTWEVKWLDKDDDPAPWVKLDRVTGTLHGTPARIGKRRLSVVVTDGLKARAGSEELLLEVRPPAERPFRILPVELPRAVLGRNYTAGLAAADSGGHVWWQLGWEEKPAWLQSLSDGAYLQLTGQPTRLGTWAFTVKARDTDCPPDVCNEAYTFATAGPKRYQITVERPPPGPPVVLTEALPPAYYGTPYVHCLRAGGGTPPYRWGMNLQTKALGDWLDLDPDTGLLSGTPHRIGTLEVDVMVQDAFQQRAGKAGLTLEVRAPEYQEPFGIATPQLPIGVLGHQYVAEIAAANGLGHVRWELRWEAAPAWVATDATGPSVRLAGRPPTPGTWKLAVRARDCELPGRFGDQNGEVFATSEAKEYEIVVCRPPSVPVRVSTESLSSCFYKVPLSHRFAAEGGIPPYTWHIEWLEGGPPEWTAFEARTGVLSGTPPFVDTRKLAVTVTDRLGEKARKADLALATQPVPGEPLRLISGELPVAIVGRQYAAEVVAPNGRGHVRWRITRDQAPAWLTTEVDGSCLRVRGRPDRPGNWTLAVAARDFDRPGDLGDEGYAFSPLVEEAYTVIAIEGGEEPAPLRIVTEALPVAFSSFPYTVHLAAAGGQPPIEFEGDRENPPWVKIGNDGKLAAVVPDAPCEAIIKVRARDRRGHESEPVALPLRVKRVAPSDLEVPDLPTIVAVRGEALSLRMPIVGGIPPYDVSFAGEPLPGFAFVPGTPTLRGTPSQCGTFAIQVDVEDASPTPQTERHTLLLKVIPPTDDARGVSSTELALVAALAAGLLALLLALAVLGRRARRPADRA